MDSLSPGGHISLHRLHVPVSDSTELVKQKGPIATVCTSPLCLPGFWFGGVLFFSSLTFEGISLLTGRNLKPPLPSDLPPEAF